MTQRYGNPFQYTLNGQQHTEKIEYQLKTIRHLLELIKKQFPNKKYMAFESEDRSILLSEQMPIKDCKHIYIYEIDQTDMINIHIIFGDESESFYVNKKTHLSEVIKAFNKESKQQIQENTSLWIANDLEPAKKVDKRNKPLMDFGLNELDAVLYEDK